MGAKGSDLALSQLVSDLFEEDETVGELEMEETGQKPILDEYL